MPSAPSDRGRAMRSDKCISLALALRTLSESKSETLELGADGVHLAPTGLLVIPANAIMPSVPQSTDRLERFSLIIISALLPGCFGHLPGEQDPSAAVECASPSPDRLREGAIPPLRRP